MRVLLDEMLPTGRRGLLPGHDVGLVLIPDNDVDLLRPSGDRLLTAIDGMRPRDVVRFGRLESNGLNGPR